MYIIFSDWLTWHQRQCVHWFPGKPQKAHTGICAWNIEQRKKENTTFHILFMLFIRTDKISNIKQPTFIGNMEKHRLILVHIFEDKLWENLSVSNDNDAVVSVAEYNLTLFQVPTSTVLQTRPEGCVRFRFFSYFFHIPLPLS